MARNVRRLIVYIGAATLTAFSLTSAALPAHAVPNVGVNGEVLSKSLVPNGIHITPTGPVDVQFSVLIVDPGGSVGWHSHPGDVLVNVADGNATRYEADDKDCKPARFTVGEGWVEHPHHVHTVRNETDKPLTLNVVLITPAGMSPGVSEPDPGNCRF
ncbi:cupin domain-containing protein [Antrihabitans stalactiti]|uniref:Cupin domain-containing protein n=1 Tax=Antrihabitans stalactiti TaxID=2584121 RepID=A0A848KHU2_9NOCA|nr:cupin domain-containing protein [Antrihabitans stalactiti]NMN97859.1 cupin domain-containing protein [Antrihabitans stalactiti]